MDCGLLDGCIIDCMDPGLIEGGITPPDIVFITEEFIIGLEGMLGPWPKELDIEFETILPIPIELFGYPDADICPPIPGIMDPIIPS